MSRAEAKRRFTLDDHVRATEGVERRKDAEVIDETPMAYKDIDAMMAAQADLLEIVHTLRQVVCVKGWRRRNEAGRRPLLALSVDAGRASALTLAWP